jgi:hypothetical protein
MALVSDTRRRLAQTGEMLLDVMGANDAADAVPFGSDTHSFRAPHGVAAVPCGGPDMLRNDPTYDAASLGVPINQRISSARCSRSRSWCSTASSGSACRCPTTNRDAYVRCGSPAATFLGIDPGAPPQPED